MLDVVHANIMVSPDLTSDSLTRQPAPQPAREYPARGRGLPAVWKGAGPLPRRVVITGMGVVTALGATLEASWSGLCEGRSGVGPPRSAPTHPSSRRQARVGPESRRLPAGPCG
jgi:hypothetical protein